MIMILGNKRTNELKKSYIISSDENPGLRIESFANNKFTWCFDKPKLIYYYSLCKTTRNKFEKYFIGGFV
jgi:hypothetical protein